MVLICKTLNSLHQVRLKLAQWFWRCRFSCQCILFYPFYVPLGNGGAVLFEQTWVTFSKGCFVPSLVEIGSVGLKKKKMKMWKVYRQTDGRTDRRTNGQTTDNRWSVKLTWAFSSRELKDLNPFMTGFVCKTQYSFVVL